MSLQKSRWKIHNMASDSKRASTSANKVPIALPKAESVQPTSANLVSQDVSLQLAVGSRCVPIAVNAKLYGQLT